MDRSVKAAMLSGLVFPGVGQLFLKRRVRGLLFLLPALVATIYFTHAVLQPVLAIAQDIGAGIVPLDPFAIQRRVEATRIDTTLMDVAVLVMVAAWIGSTLDAWLVGRTPAAVAAK